VTVPVLLCQAVGGQPAELEPHVVEPLAGSAWFALGSGNGLRVRISGRPQEAQAGDDVKVTVEVA
jgi:hypothetical protein